MAAMNSASPTNNSNVTDFTDLKPEEENTIIPAVLSTILITVISIMIVLGEYMSSRTCVSER